MKIPVLTLSIAFCLGLTGYAAAAELTAEQKKGKEIFDMRCVGCHGVKGKGDGPSADRLRPRPRNFKIARYKFTYTMFGKLPQDDTLFKWISQGLPGTSMPAWSGKLSDEDIRNVIAYIKSTAITKKFERAKKKGKTHKPVEIGAPPKWTEEDIKQGHELFKKNCEKCHGSAGRGSGPSAVTLKHDFGDRIWPRNLTKGWTFRGGNRPEDIFRTAATGISGTPMPAHIESITAEQIWKIVGFVDSIVRREKPRVQEVIVSKFVIDGEAPVDPEDKRWEELKPGYIPLVSQIIEGDRWFTTTLESVEVRSMYGDKWIAILVEWDDPSKSPMEQQNDRFPQNEPDALAIQLPTEIPTGMERPYFLGGGEDGPVVLWKWTNGQKPVVLLGKGILKTEELPSDNQTLQVKAVYVDGRWKAVFVRPLSAPKEDLTIESGRYIPIAFSAWDGNNGEKNEQRAISIWYWLLLATPPSKMVFLWPAIIGLLVAGGEVWLVSKAKQK